MRVFADNKSMDWTSKYFVGLVSAVLVVLLTKRVVKSRWNQKTEMKPQKPLYGSDHSVLNISLPPQSMWMNMGFWKETEDFPTACRALLEEVLKSARILRDDVLSSNEVIAKTLSIIDLGFGCGDQCLYMKNVVNNQKQRRRDNKWSRFLKAYVGITLDSSQFYIAQERLGLKQPNNNTVFEIYCADAGRPSSWTLEVRNTVSMACQATDEEEDHENWILGLDAFIHFQPSRWPIIEYANKVLDASLMTYDFCIADNLSVRQRIVLRLMAVIGHSPFVNWITIQEYRERLVVAGYARDRIEIRDVSDYVFGPLAGFLRKREAQLEQYGLSIGRYRYAARMFDWWLRTGAVRGCIIIARK